MADIGDQVGSWRLVSRLGSGGMGDVFLGVDGAREAAVKVVSAGLALDPSFRSRFRREIDICRRVSGAQVAELLDADPDAPQPWLAIRYVEGATLRDAVSQIGPLHGDTLRGFALAAAAALVQIHDAGVVHRDLKPSNIILTPDTPVIIDFGIAGAVESTSLTATGTVLGSAGWMAPEQVLGRTCGPAADVFSWAAVVAFAATGRPPFGEGRPEALAYRIVHGEADLEGVDTSLGSLLTRALDQDPQARPTARELVAAMGVGTGADVGTVIAGTWVGDSATAFAEPLTVVERAPEGASKARRRPSLLTVATVLVVLALIAGVALFVQRQDDGDGATAASSGTSQEPTTTALPSVTTTSTAPPETTTTTLPAVLSIRDVDLRNRDYDVFCDASGAVTTISVEDGSWTAPEGPTYGVLEQLSVDYADVTGDGVEDAYVNLPCSVGQGSNAWATTVVLQAGAQDAEPVGQPIPSATVFKDGGLVGETAAFADSDPMCCPSEVERSNWVFRSGGWSQESITRVAAAESYLFGGA